MNVSSHFTNANYSWKICFEQVNGFPSDGMICNCHRFETFILVTFTHFRVLSLLCRVSFDLEDGFSRNLHRYVLEASLRAD